MIHVIVPLLLCNLVSPSSEAQSIFKKTESQVFTELKAIKDPVKKMEFVDSEISKYFSDGTYTATGAKSLIGLRENLCRDNSGTCLNTSAWNKNSCIERSDAQKGEIQILAWKSAISSVKSDEQLNLFLAGLSRCAGALNSVQLRIAVELAIGIESGGIPASLSTVMKWIGSKSASEKGANVLEIFDQTLDGLRKIPVPVHLLAGIALLPLRTPNAVHIRGRLLAKYLSSIAFDASMTGQMGELNEFIDRVPSAVSDLDPGDEMGLAGIRCVHWVSSGNSRRCEILLESLRKKAQASPALKVGWGLVMARFLYLTGRPERASALIDEMIILARKQKLEGQIPLLDYSLSNYLPMSGKFNEARAALDAFKSAMAGRDMGWLKVILFTREQAIAFMEGKCSSSISTGEAGRSYLRTTAIGPNSELMWIDMMQLMCFAELKDKAKVAFAHNRIRAGLQRMPDLHYVLLLEQAVMERFQGLDGTGPLNEAKKRLGEKHPDIVLVESGLKRIH